MKNILIFLILLFSETVLGQITIKPEIDRLSDDNTDISKVEINEQYTVITFSYLERGQIGLKGGQIIKYSHTISIDPQSYLKVGEKKFKFIKAMGIPVFPSETEIEVGEKIFFKGYYQVLEKGMELFDFVEGKNSKEISRHFWNFYGVHITNPANKKAKPIVVKPVLAAKIIVKGKVFDARTNLPIIAKIVCSIESSERKVDSISTSLSGDYRLEIKPNSYYFDISAKGYEATQEVLDLSKVTGKGIFNKNFTLNPLEKPLPKLPPILLPDTTKIAETKPIEPPLDVPKKVEENKFRLDKVYFEVSEAKLLPSSFPQLEGLLKMMKESPTMTIQIEGHTDNVGDKTLNKRLSLDRAFAVRQYLIENGILGNRIKFVGLGDSKPIADNNTEDGRRQNRRVDFIILSK